MIESKKLGSNNNAEQLLRFVTDTIDGKYTKEKPVVTQVTYKRLEITKQLTNDLSDESSEEMILFGITY